MTSENLSSPKMEATSPRPSKSFASTASKIAVVDSKGQLVGLITYRDIIKLSEFPNSCKDQYGRLRVAAVGVTADAR